MAAVETPEATPRDEGRSRRADLDTAWIAVALLIPAFVALITPLRMVDLAYHVRLGSDMLQTGAIVDVDTMTFSVHGAVWTNQQWLAQVAFAVIERAGGWNAIVVARGLMIGLTSGFLYLACRGRGATPRSASLLTLASFLVALPALAMRPQMFGIVLFAVALWVAASRHRHPARLWLLPMCALLDANMHGSFPLIVLVAILVVVEDASSRHLSPLPAGVLAVTLVATFVNPYGAGVWAYAWAISTNDQIRTAVTEWQSLGLRDYLGIATFASLGTLIWYLARRATATRWIDLIWLTAFLVPALLAERAAAWWAMTAAVVVAGLLPVRQSSAPSGTGAPAAALPAYAIIGSLVLAVGIAAAIPWVRGSVVIRDAPPGLVGALGRLPVGSRVFLHQTWGSWAELEAPEYPVLVDSRIELFPDRVWDDYAQVAFAGAGWREALARWRPDAIVADKESWDLIPLLREADTWQIAAEDDDLVLFVKAG